MEVYHNIQFNENKQAFHPDVQAASIMALHLTNAQTDFPKSDSFDEMWCAYQMKHMSIVVACSRVSIDPVVESKQHKALIVDKTIAIRQYTSLNTLIR